MSMKYYNGLDGLRAVSLLLVLFYHVNFTPFINGFLGVDIFFAISGFIISRNILLQIENKTFSILSFYKRRFARLYPALLATIGITLFSAYLIFPINDINEISRSAIRALHSFSNFCFNQQSGYFEESAYVKPLLHTWSLGVEEQFYLIWPILLVFLTKFKRNIFLSLCLVFISCISLYSVIVIKSDWESEAFFLMPFRIYQFGIGALAYL